jgi:hypothetical protein
MQKIKVKKLTDRQRFELLFREPTEEEKEIIKMNMLAKEKKMMESENMKKKTICKIKPYFAIKEDLGNGYHITYYRFSGHAILYKDNKLVTVIQPNNFIVDSTKFKFVPWLYNVEKGMACIKFDSAKYKSYYDQVKTELLARRLGSSRHRFTIIKTIKDMDNVL